MSRASREKTRVVALGKNPDIWLIHRYPRHRLLVAPRADMGVEMMTIDAPKRKAYRITRVGKFVFMQSAGNNIN